MGVGIFHFSFKKGFFQTDPMAKIHVVGGGPAGSIAAISAIRNGHNVIMSEEHETSGEPENCSGLFSCDGLKSLSDFINPKKFTITAIKGAIIHLPEENLTIRRKEPVGLVCNRASMDQELAISAQAEGAKIKYGNRINGSFESSNIIGADGPLSSVAMHFGFPKIKKFASTLQALIHYKSEDPEMVEVFLSNSLFPGFFGWIIPHDEYTAEFGVGVEMPGNMPSNVKNAWDRLLKMKGIRSDAKVKGAVIPLRIRGRTSMKRRGWNIILTGDAAGQVKATTGGGVVFGGNCAALAGMYATDPLKYEITWRTRFWPDLALHERIHDFLATAPESSLSSLGRMFKKLNIDGYLSDYGHMDRPTKMLRLQLLSYIFKNFQERNLLTR